MPTGAVQRNELQQSRNELQRDALEWVHLHVCLELRRRCVPDLRDELRKLPIVHSNSLHHRRELQRSRKLCQWDSREWVHMHVFYGLHWGYMQHLLHKLQWIPDVCGNQLHERCQLQQPRFNCIRDACFWLCVHMQCRIHESYLRGVRDQLRKLPNVLCCCLQSQRRLQCPRDFGERDTRLRLLVHLFSGIQWHNVQCLCCEVLRLPNMCCHPMYRRR